MFDAWIGDLLIRLPRQDEEAREPELFRDRLVARGGGRLLVQALGLTPAVEVGFEEARVPLGDPLPRLLDVDRGRDRPGLRAARNQEPEPEDYGAHATARSSRHETPSTSG